MVIDATQTEVMCIIASVVGAVNEKGLLTVCIEDTSASSETATSSEKNYELHIRQTPANKHTVHNIFKQAQHHHQTWRESVHIIPLVTRQITVD